MYVCVFVQYCRVFACLSWFQCKFFNLYDCFHFRVLECKILRVFVIINVCFSKLLFLLLFAIITTSTESYPDFRRSLFLVTLRDKLSVPLFREKKKRKAKKWAWIKPSTSDIKRSKVCHNWWLLRPTSKRHHTIRESSFLLVYYLTNCCTADFPQLFPTCWVPNKYGFVRQIFVWQHSRSRDLLWPGREALCWCQQQQSETLLADRLKPMHTLPQTVCCVSRRACCAAIHKHSFICRGSSWVTWNEGQRPWIHRSARRFQRVTRLIWTVSQMTTHFRKRHLYVKCAFVYLSI